MLVSCNHIFVENGKFLKTAAFGGHPLELVVSFPYLDIILLKGGLLAIVLQASYSCVTKKRVKMLHMCLQR